MKAADALQRIGAEAEAGGQLPLYRHSIGEPVPAEPAPHRRAAASGVQAADVGDGDAVTSSEPEHRGIGVGQRAPMAPSSEKARPAAENTSTKSVSAPNRSSTRVR